MCIRDSTRYTRIDEYSMYLVSVRHPCAEYSWAMAKNGTSRSILGQKRVGRRMKAANTQFGLTWLTNTTFHPFLAVHRPGRPDSRYFGQLPPGFGHILLYFVALHQSIRSEQNGVELHVLSARQKANGTETKSCSSTAAINSTKDSYILRSNIYSSRQHSSN